MMHKCSVSTSEIDAILSTVAETLAHESRPKGEFRP
ncbi:unnamed protein product, partial [marine sediment metagenome]